MLGLSHSKFPFQQINFSQNTSVDVQGVSHMVTDDLNDTAVRKMWLFM